LLTDRGDLGWSIDSSYGVVGGGWDLVGICSNVLGSEAALFGVVHPADSTNGSDGSDSSDGTSSSTGRFFFSRLLVVFSVLASLCHFGIVVLDNCLVLHCKPSESGRLVSLKHSLSETGWQITNFSGSCGKRVSDREISACSFGLICWWDTVEITESDQSRVSESLNLTES